MAESSIDKTLVRARALRAARAVAIVATLSAPAAGCSRQHARVTAEDDASVVDASSQSDLGELAHDAEADAQSVLADAETDQGAEDASTDAVVADAAQDASRDAAQDASADLAVAEEDASEPEFPCVTDGGGIDWDCCSSMSFPPGCPIIGPFVPPSMDA